MHTTRSLGFSVSVFPVDTRGSGAAVGRGLQKEGASLAAVGVSPLLAAHANIAVLTLGQPATSSPLISSLVAMESVFVRIFSYRLDNKCQVDLRIVPSSVSFGLPPLQLAGYKLFQA